ncbi:hypothetical protein A9Q84_11425 [Halobacteriovorax marinus]|uniref:tRNA pseudouridine synthase D n=1 Tax=Halobacteriovorax marinus TaxID=97084 RepID=A0A1Y5FD90_9BACT|nr:hypothetical protein A9Q84_11425 [Halobacteriovorax marinus]
MDLNYITSKQLKTGGVIKMEASDFQVEEVPLYLPTNTGQHVYLLIKRANLNTKDVVKSLRQCFKITEKDIGHAGLKDRNAITTQWFSLSLGATKSLEEVQSELSEACPELEILEVSKHSNKLKLGHLIGNRFHIRLRQVNDNAFENAEKIYQELKEKGFPNYYGPQRFGSKGDNGENGKLMILGEKKVKSHFMKKLLISAYQSQLFNRWLNSRIEDGIFTELIEGDLLQTNEGQRPFPFDPTKEHVNEFTQREISYTGPMFGYKVSTPELIALEREQSILNDEGIEMEILKQKGIVGARRIARIFPGEFKMTKGDNFIDFSFILPTGCYATTILREFMKSNEL